MPIYTGIQRRNSVIGVLRCGEQVEVKSRSGGDTTAPRALTKWRVTTHAQVAAEQVAAQFGGEPRPWAARPGQWEVYTDAEELPVALPPGDLVISQWMERWSGGGCTMRCDGRRTILPEIGQCQCPQPDNPDDEASVWAAIDKRHELAALKVPRGCKPYTRLSLCLPDIGDVGVFQLTSTSEQAAAEIAMKALIMEAHRARGVFLPARVGIEPRQSVVRGQTRHFVVPVLRLDNTIREIMTGEPGRLAAAQQLPPPPGERLAITAGAAPRTPAQRPAADDDSEPLTAQQIADIVSACETRAQVDTWAAKARDNRVEADLICVPGQDTEQYEELRAFVNAKWKSLPPPARREARSG